MEDQNQQLPQNEQGSPEEQHVPTMEQPSETNSGQPQKSHKTAIIAGAVGLIVIVAGAAAYFGGGQLFQGSLRMAPTNDINPSVTPIESSQITEIESPQSESEVSLSPSAIQEVPLEITEQQNQISPSIDIDIFTPELLIPEAQVPDSPVPQVMLPAPGALSCDLNADPLVLEGNNIAIMDCSITQNAKSAISIIFAGSINSKQEAQNAPVVKHLGTLPSQNVGSFIYSWNGQDTNNTDVPPGTYTFAVATSYEGYQPDILFKQIEVVANAPAPTPQPQPQPQSTPTPTPTPTPQTSEPATQTTTTETTTTETTAQNCAGFPDISTTDPDCPAISFVKDIGAITGTGDAGYFDPNGRLQRDQIAKIALETFGLFSEGSNYCEGSRAFPDVGPNAWSFEYMCRAKKLGVVTGYESGPDAGYYLPANLVNRAEFLAIILRNLNEAMPTSGQNYADANNQWFSEYARFAFENGLFPGSDLEPNDSVTRREVARVLYRLKTLAKI